MKNEQTRWDDVSVGDELPRIEKTPTVQGAVIWGAASGDFNPLHYDQEFAKGRGLKTMIVPGAYKHAAFGQLLYEWARYGGRIKKFAVSYRGMDAPGQRMVFCGRVTRKFETDGECMVEVDIWSESVPDRTITTSGTATVVLPRSAVTSNSSAAA